MSDKAVLKAIEKSRNVLVTMHVNPDTDAVSSALVTAMFLKSLGKQVTVVNADPVPDWLVFLPNTKWIISAAEVKAQMWDTVITLDCGDLNRIGLVSQLISKDAVVVNIDHHVTNDRFGHVNYVDDKASSTAEILYRLFSQAGFKWTTASALLVYAGIMTDTGSFRFDCTSAYTHKVVSELMKFKISVSDLYGRIYDTVPKEDLKLLTKTFNAVELIDNERVAYLVLSKRMQNQFSDQFDIREKVFNFLRSVVGLEVILIFTEVKPKVTKVNFRSCGSFDVAGLAGLFGGGGHPKASGCTVENSLAQVKTAVLEAVRKGL